ncbi:MAG: DUF3379 domain-containing protein [Gammaproteobacteria bacterium]|nr:DUF3379 domain-containing protein [Gammaproteobacteria bacterium]
MMNDSQIHLSDEQLDQRRAGLLNTPQMEAHLNQCPSCQKRAGAWDRIAAHLNDRTADEMVERLRAHRRSILSNTNRTRRRVIPHMATAALIAMVVGVGLYTQLQPLSPLPDGANNMTANTELFTEIDFYVWMGQQEKGAPPVGSKT